MYLTDNNTTKYCKESGLEAMSEIDMGD